MRDSTELAREFPDVEAISDEAKRIRSVFRFRAVPDDAFFGPLMFDVLESREGSLRFLEPSRRSYEELAAVIAGLVVLFFSPYLLGLLPWSLLVASLARDNSAVSAYSFDARTTELGFMLLFLVVALASGAVAPRLMAHHPRVTESVRVKERDKGTPTGHGLMQYRLLLTVPGSSFWVSLKAKPDVLEDALEVAGQTT